MQAKQVTVQGHVATLWLGNKGIWYGSERQAKDSWLPQPLEKLIALITK